jgi:predicted GH43/DUF377 family glycosyl hydrolase
LCCDVSFPLIRNLLKISLSVCIIVEKEEEQSLHVDAAIKTEEEEEEDSESARSNSDDSSQWMGKIGFFSGNPTVETVKGILHIYKNK